ncbi:Uncharacterised protein [Bordetella pertussis]|nr:Uncharacterised protein [Bordetella pertussis]
MQPATLSALVMNITRPLGNESAKAPTNAASTTYARAKDHFIMGAIQSGPLNSRIKAIAAMNSALSARDEKACAAITR